MLKTPATIAILPANLISRSELILGLIGKKADMFSITSLEDHAPRANTFEVKIFFYVVYTKRTIPCGVVDIF